MDIISYIGYLWKIAFGTWFFFWVVRRQGEFDYPLEPKTKVLRWCVIAAAIACTRVHGPEFKALRLAAALVGLAFLCWPNFAYHIACFLGWQQKEVV